jgi:hypothetical protein
LSHGGTTIYSSTTPSQQILIGTREGASPSSARVEISDWRITNRAIADKHISAIVTEPESGLTFAGAFLGGVLVSADGGKSWEGAQ